MWTDENRKRYDRSKLRYPSDLTDAEWALVARLIPPPKPGGNKRTVEIREIVNGLMYVRATGRQWRAVPKDLPPRSTLFDYFTRWSEDGALDDIRHELYVRRREQAGRAASATAGEIDSQSVKSAEKGGALRPAWLRRGQEDQRQEAPHPRRHRGLPDARPRPRSRRPGSRRGRPRLATLFGLFPFLAKLYADGGYRGPEFSAALKRTVAHVNVEIVKRSDKAKGFVALPRRWVVERTFAWFGRCRRLAKDWECMNRRALAFLRWASVRLMLRRLCNHS